MSFTNKVGLVMIVGAAFASASSAMANVIIDGGFEADISGNYSPFKYNLSVISNQFGPGGVWHVDNETVLVVSSTSVPMVAHTGENALQLGGDSVLSQMLNTVAGTSYQLSFYATADAAAAISIDFGGNPRLGTINIPQTYIAPSPDARSTANIYTGYHKFSYSLIANSDTTLLRLKAISSTNSLYLDDFDLTPIDSLAVSPSPVPEPASLALFGTALLGLGFTRYVRKQSI